MVCGSCNAIDCDRTFDQNSSTIFTPAEFMAQPELYKSMLTGREYLPAALEKQYNFSR